MAGVAAFVGSWREEEKTGFNEMADQIGLPAEKKEFFKQARTEITYSQNGDEWEITVGMAGVPDKRTFKLKLGEEYESASLDGSPLKSVMTADGGKFVEKHIDKSMNDMEMNITRHIEGDKMVVVTKVGSLEMQSKYGKI
ncbi:fatty acid-binding protein type 3-like isoform X2 [Mercenaria mercenaria]|uniref:fatty acid-binding protein type 3-like isoform X2 n=1 Tax=Mercenaria mercenaria TaxID=6596 RepID=UPI00234E8BE8|nr:fatty acid-binding protein type 3-like isoform X2 [Mercenaria mercenaria]